VPSMIEALLGVAQEQFPPRKLRWLLPTGEALSPDLCRNWLARYPEIPMLNAYGPAECADDVAYHKIIAAPGSKTRIMPIGRPVANLRLYILDRWLDPVPPGVPGELCVAGMGVGRGYINRPDWTAASFVPDPFGESGGRLYRTGDLARYQDDGTIEFLGRIDNQVKIRGYRVELGEIEAQLKECPWVSQAAVMAWPDNKLGHRLVGYIVPTEQGKINPNALNAVLRERVPDYMVPSAWIELSSLPLNANGKLDRKALPRPLLANRAGDFQAPLSPVEQILAGLWAEVLERDCIGRHDNFFDLGGHSLLAMQAIARTNQAFSLNLPLQVIFDAPTIASFRRYLDVARNRGEALAGLPAAPRDKSLPLSRAQQRLWFMSKIDPLNPLYHFAVAVRVSGPFDAGVFEASLNVIVQRHESLRTVVKEIQGEPFQVILPELKLNVEREQVQENPNGLDGFNGDLVSRMRQAAAAPFDIACGPLVRAKVYSLFQEQTGTDKEFAVLLCFHHIVFDGWSFGVFLKEFAALYPAIQQGYEPPLPQLPLQYADYAMWDQERLQSKELTDQREYWIEQLRGAPTCLEIPTDHSRVMSAANAAGWYEFELSEMGTALASFARKHAATSFMVALSCYAILLSYLSGSRDLVIGTDVANRRRSEFEPLIGFFINLIALRIRLEGDPSFLQIVRSVREVTLEAYNNQDFPFDKIVEALRPRRSLQDGAIFQTKLVCHNVPLGELVLPGLRFDPIPFDAGRTELDLVLHLFEGPQGVRAVFEYRTALFEEATIARFSELFRLLLEVVLSDSGTSLDDSVSVLAQHDRALRSAARAKQRAGQLGRLLATKRRGIEAPNDGVHDYDSSKR
jgi:hypothetical protein